MNSKYASVCSAMGGLHIVEDFEGSPVRPPSGFFFHNPTAFLSLPSGIFTDCKIFWRLLFPRIEISTIYTPKTFGFSGFFSADLPGFASDHLGMAFA